MLGMCSLVGNLLRSLLFTGTEGGGGGVWLVKVVLFFLCVPSSFISWFALTSGGSQIHQLQRDYRSTNKNVFFCLGKVGVAREVSFNL